MSSRYRNLPPLNVLAAFEAVARLQSFSGAANELCVTHSAVSHRIKVLEDHFGVSFFHRRGRNVALTAKGRYFLEAVLDALSTLQQASLKVYGSKRSVLRVNVGPSFARYWLVSVLGDFYTRYRDIELEICATKFVRQYKMSSLNSGEWDIAICYGRSDEWRGFTAIKLMDGELFPVCSPSYRNSCGTLKNPKDLLNSVLLRLPHESWNHWFQAAGLTSGEPEHGPIFSDASLMLDAAINGQGVALARSVLVNEHLSAQRLVRLFRVSVQSACTYHAIFRPDSIDRYEVRSFLDWLTSRVECGNDADKIRAATPWHGEVLGRAEHPVLRES